MKLASTPATTPAEVYLDQVLTIMAGSLDPAVISLADIGQFGAEQREWLVTTLAAQLPHRVTAPDLGIYWNGPWDAAPRGVRARTEANLSAMGALAYYMANNGEPPRFLDAEDVVKLLRDYTGWGGLSLKRVAPDAWPEGIPQPEERALVHEYYTPARVWGTVLSELTKRGFIPRHGVRALEPSAGIGRAPFAARTGLLDIDWTLVEASAVSAAMLRAMGYPNVMHSYFESVAAELGQQNARPYNLVVSNPPYGARGEAMELDGGAYRTKRAYVYFVVRCLDFLSRGGIAVYLVPTGMMSGRGPEFRRHREALLLRGHLLAAMRLPSQSDEGEDGYVYDQFVTDLIILQGRGGVLPSVLPQDLRVLDGHYFADHPEHVLGTPVGQDADGWEPGDPVARRGFQLVGSFKRLPWFVPRPLPLEGYETGPEAKGAINRGGLSRDEKIVEGLDEDLTEAQAIGLRIDRYLTQVAAGAASAALDWPELRNAALGWFTRHGDPLLHGGLDQLAKRRVLGAVTFLSVWAPGGRLIPLLEDPPVVEAASYRGEPQVLAYTEWLWRQQAGALDVHSLTRSWFAQFGSDLPADAIDTLLATGWCFDAREGEQPTAATWVQLVPGPRYETGLLWPRLDRAVAAASQKLRNAKAQVLTLRTAIGWTGLAGVMDGLSPTHAWLDLDLVADFVGGRTGQAHVALERVDGVLRPQGVEYRSLVNTDKARSPGFSADFLSFLGWANYDRQLWKPPRDKVPDPSDPTKEKLEPMDDARRKWEVSWRAAFAEWIEVHPKLHDRLEASYNRRLRGYIVPPDDFTPLTIARWANITPRPWQTAATRRLAEQRAGLVAFDVGLGKTYTGLQYIALGRQEGWIRRPVIVVPNSIAWKWARDVAHVLPDYTVEVIGSALKVGRDGRVKSRPDTSEERANKWRRFQAGAVDIVLLTYSALDLTQLTPDFVERYGNSTTSLRRAIAMAVERREAEAEGDEAAPRGAKQSSERKIADAKERARATLGDLLSPSTVRGYDPGIAWDLLGIDCLLVDEAQNFKNLFTTARETSSPTDTKRAWALDARAAAVRETTGGSGVILLSATPAKNSPTEWFSLLHIMNPQALVDGASVDNPEEFVDRFAVWDEREVPDPSGQKLVKRTVCIDLQNVDQLRSVMDRWSIYRNAEMVGLPLPRATVVAHSVDLSPVQRDVVGGLFAELADVEQRLTKLAGAAAGGSPEAERAYKALIQKKTTLAMQLYLVYLHPGLLKGNVAGASAKDGPKLLACVDEVMNTAAKTCRSDGDDEACLDCGHIIFVENIAVHAWMKALLVDRGIDPARIAILNAVAVPDTESRQQIAEAFNGRGLPSEDDYAAPGYDVVIANQVAYEGVDLQRRTCAIHHLDVPWEPATLQQRNGRGVRQGNNFADVSVHFYFVRGSNESWKVSKLERKRGWMDALFAGSARTTNTTKEAAGEDYDAAEQFLANAPPEVAAQIRAATEERKQAEAIAAHVKAQVSTNTAIVDLNRGWRLYERELDAATRSARFERMQRETAALIARVTAAGTPIYPFDVADRIKRVSELPVFVPRRGPALFAGECIVYDGQVCEVGTWGIMPERLVQQVTGHWRSSPKNRDVFGCYLRLPGYWTPRDFIRLDADLVDDHEVLVGAAWPVDEDILTEGGSPRWWDIGQFHAALLMTADRHRARMWTGLQRVLNYTNTVASIEAVCVLRDGGAIVLKKDEIIPSDVTILPPTLDGWREWSAACTRLVESRVEAERGTLLKALRSASRRWFHRTLITGLEPAREAT